MISFVFFIVSAVTYTAVRTGAAAAGAAALALFFSLYHAVNNERHRYHKNRENYSSTHIQHLRPVRNRIKMHSHISCKLVKLFNSLCIDYISVFTPRQQL